MDASNYKDIASGKATASLSILLNKDNLINKTVELTQILKSVAAPPLPVLTISASTTGDTLGVAYRSPYKLPSKTTPIQTAMAFERKNNKISGTLKANLGTMTNPTIVPKVIELKGVSMKEVKLGIGFKPGGKKVPEITVDFETPEMVVKKNTTYAPVHLQLAMTPAGTPTGALIKLESNDTVDIAAIADLAEVAFSANPSSQLLNLNKWANINISKSLKLNKLPKIGIKNQSFTSRRRGRINQPTLRTSTILVAPVCELRVISLSSVNQWQKPTSV
jgi:hypothetical protein